MKQNVILFLSMVLVAVYSHCANAIAVNSIFFATHNQELIIPFTNNTAKTNSYSIKIVETTFPDKRAKIIKRDIDGLEVKNATIKVSSGGTGQFKLIFKPPFDNKFEHYFRAYIVESPVDELNNMMRGSKSTIAMPVKIGLILFLEPHEINVLYEYRNRVFKNKGNVSLFIMRDLECGKTQNLTMPVAPQTEIILPEKIKNEIIRVGQGDKILTIDDSCG